MRRVTRLVINRAKGQHWRWAYIPFLLLGYYLLVGLVFMPIYLGCYWLYRLLTPRPRGNP